MFEKFDNESDFAKERTGRVLLFESKELDILHTVPRRDPSRAKRCVGEGRVVWGNRWELGEVRSHPDPVTCEALSITRNLDFGYKGEHFSNTIGWFDLENPYCTWLLGNRVMA